MFVPNEALGFEALRLIPDLHEYASGRNVVVATPSTLIAMLRSVAYGWKQAKLAESAAQVSTLGRELYERLGTDGRPQRRQGRARAGLGGQGLQRVGGLRPETRVMVTARRFRDLNVTEAELGELTPIEEPLRRDRRPRARGRRDRRPGRDRRSRPASCPRRPRSSGASPTCSTWWARPRPRWRRRPASTREWTPPAPAR